MKRATGEFESRRRIEILSNDKRFLLRMIKKIISYQGLLTVVLGILLLNCLLNYLDKMVLFFLLICFVAVMLQDLLQIKRYGGDISGFGYLPFSILSGRIAAGDAGGDGQWASGDLFGDSGQYGSDGR